GSKRRIPDRSGSERRLITGTGHRLVEADRGEQIGLPTGLTPCTAEPELAYEGDVPEGLIAHDPGKADLGVQRRLVVGPEGAVVVAANGRGEEDPVLPPELLLQVQTDGLVLDERLVAEGDRGGVEGRYPRCGEL